MKLDECTRIEPMLFAMFEDGVSAPESTRVTAHLAQCDGCRELFEEERLLTARLRAQRSAQTTRPRRVVLVAATVLASAFAAKLWFGGEVPRGAIFSTQLGSLVSPFSEERPLAKLNHFALPAGSECSIRVDDVGHIHANGPVSFGLDQTEQGWKLTLLAGSVGLEVDSDSRMHVASARFARELASGHWVITIAAARSLEQDSPAALLRRAIRTFQVEHDMESSERQLRIVADHVDATKSQRRRALYFLFAAQQHLRKHAEAVETIDVWLREYPDDDGAPRVLLHRGVNLAMGGDVDAAFEVWDAMLERFEGHEILADVHDLKTQFARMRGRTASADGLPDTERWARECATETDWVFDASTGLERSRERERPMLVYVRNVHTLRSHAKAHASVTASGVPLHDTGYATDLMFRASVLADERVAQLVHDAFVPTMLTYDFHSHGKGIADATWRALGSGALGEATFDEREGAAKAGSLTLTGASSFLQSILRPEMRVGDTLRFTAKAKTEAATGEVRVYWSDRRGDQTRGGTESIEGNTDWTELHYEFEPARPLINVLVMPTARGRGQVWFDDCELAVYREGRKIVDNLLRNGACDRDISSRDPLQPLGLRAKDIVPPALLVVRDGDVTHRLHRIGAMSPEFALGWLDDAVDANAPGLRPDLHAAMAALRDANWARAARELASLDFDEAGFLHGLALHRLGEHERAAERWRQVAGPTRHGRRAAACLLEQPNVTQAISLRRWATPRKPHSTESGPDAVFDAARSIDILLELQQPSGGFVDHNGSDRGGQLRTHWDIAYTAIAGDALRRWRAHVAPEKRERIDDAVAKARRFLVAASHERAGSHDAFNDPYAIDFLVDVEEHDAAARFVDRIQKQQRRDGCWTVYGPQRPTTFNTAQNVLALLRAKGAGIAIDEDALARGLESLADMRQEDGQFSYAPLPGFRWMTTPLGGVAREPLCEHALLAGSRGDVDKLDAALRRFVELNPALREPTKHYSSDFNKKGHGSYFFYYAHRNAIDATAHATPQRRADVHEAVRTAVIASMEGDGSFLDHALYGRVYGTAMALSILARIRNE